MPRKLDLASATPAELEARKTELVAQMRAIEDQIEEVEAEEQRRVTGERDARTAAEVARLLGGMTPEARSAVIAGAAAGAAAAGEAGGRG